MNDLTHEYKSWISELKTRYKQAQIKASVAVNGELLKFYFELGKDISEKQFANSYGSAFYKTLSSDLITEFPDAKGFSPTNLKYSFYFYDLYKAEFQNRPQVVDDLCRIPWGHHVQIIGKCKNDSKKHCSMLSRLFKITGQEMCLPNIHWKVQLNLLLFLNMNLPNFIQ